MGGIEMSFENNNSRVFEEYRKEVLALRSRLAEVEAQRDYVKCLLRLVAKNLKEERYNSAEGHINEALAKLEGSYESK
jgi:hypothetical protein